MGKQKQDFDDFLCERNDVVDNAAHDLALAMLSANGTAPDEAAFPWSMEIIGAILESTMSILDEHGYHACWPYHENDEIPCHSLDKCKNKDCPFKR